MVLRALTKMNVWKVINKTTKCEQTRGQQTKHYSTLSTDNGGGLCIKKQSHKERECEAVNERGIDLSRRRSSGESFLLGKLWFVSLFNFVGLMW